MSKRQKQRLPTDLSRKEKAFNFTVVQSFIALTIDLREVCVWGGGGGGGGGGGFTDKRLLKASSAVNVLQQKTMQSRLYTLHTSTQTT